MRRAITAGEQQEGQIYLHRRDGKLISIFSRLTPVRDAGGEIIGAVEIFSDNTPNMDLLRRMQELQSLAMQDPLTGLANRRLGEMTLQARLMEWARHQWLFGVLFIDVDGFKEVNDRHGHTAGDEVLRGLAERLQKNLRSFDTACRWGGDEFVIVLGHVREDQVQFVANKILALLSEEPYASSAGPVRIGVSIGAVVAQQGDSTSGIIERADAGMFQSKRRGGRCITMQ